MQVTIEDAGKQVPIDTDTLRFYEKQGLLRLEYLDAAQAAKELQDIQDIDSLARIGVELEELKRLKGLMNQGTGTVEEQIRLLKRCRFQMLDDIHVRQQLLDRIDYMIHTRKQN